MPPKGNKTAKAADKAKQAARQKVVEDKTFGLKNKNKSSKVQKYVQQMQKSASAHQKNANEPSKKDKKKAELEQQKELDALFAMAIKQPKVPPGVDPKTIVCEFFKHGKCTKSFKCKFSHDLSVERKGPKLDLYSDRRDDSTEGGEGMEDWDQETLEKAIAQKHGSENQNRPTSIVCKYFLDAVEKRQYGWFWQCPNGKDCKYRHALPPGYVLKSQMKQLLEEEVANKKSVEEEIEDERATVEAKTPITQDVFEKWKAEKDLAKKKILQDKEFERKKKGVLTGKEIFEQEGFVAQDDASASDAYARDVDDEEEIQKMYAKAQEDLDRARTETNNGPDSEAPKIEDIIDDISDDDDVLDQLTANLALGESSPHHSEKA